MKTSTKILVATAATLSCLIALGAIAWLALPTSGDDSYELGAKAGQAVTKWLGTK